ATLVVVFVPAVLGGKTGFLRTVGCTFASLILPVAVFVGANAAGNRVYDLLEPPNYTQAGGTGTNVFCSNQTAHISLWYYTQYPIVWKAHERPVAWQKFFSEMTWNARETATHIFRKNAVIARGTGYFKYSTRGAFEPPSRFDTRFAKRIMRSGFAVQGGFVN